MAESLATEARARPGLRGAVESIGLSKGLAKLHRIALGSAHAVGQFSPCGRVANSARSWTAASSIFARAVRRWRACARIAAGLARAAPRPARRPQLDEVELSPPFPNPTRSSASASTTRATSARSAASFPPCPAFLRLHNTLVPHGGSIVRPRASIDFDFRGRACVVIGERCRHVPRASALSVVAGYTMLPRRQRARLPEALR
jgi:2-keto-4-pentenoate hydratase/2-oxohepta-3-ene-1,7-dioic acid hydratase in catechol pathway